MALEFAGADTATTLLTQVTSGGGAGTKGSYTQLIASTARQSYQITLQLQADGNKNSFQVFVATGGAGAETDVLKLTYWSGSGTGVQAVTFPLTIASGTRVSVAIAAGGAAATLRVAVCLSDVSAYGTGSQHFITDTSGGGSNYQGIDVDPGGTAHTKGSWTQLVASSPNDADLLTVCIGMSNNNALTAATWLVDIGTGAAASETVLLENIPHFAQADEDGCTYYAVLANIPSGTRISARAQCTIIDAADRIIDVAVVGVNMTAPAGGTGISRLAGGGLVN